MSYSITTHDQTVSVRRPDGHVEQHSFATAESAEKRATFVREALTWVGTPFVDCADVKGPRGGVDCAMMLVRSTVDTGLLRPFEPRPYSPRHMLHSDEQKFLEWVKDRLGAVEVGAARFGDLHIWQFGRCFCHGGVRLADNAVVHAFNAEGFCNVTRIDTPLLTHIGVNRLTIPRPVKFFDLFGG